MGAYDRISSECLLINR